MENRGDVASHRITLAHYVSAPEHLQTDNPIGALKVKPQILIFFNNIVR